EGADYRVATEWMQPVCNAPVRLRNCPGAPYRMEVQTTHKVAKSVATHNEKGRPGTAISGRKYDRIADAETRASALPDGSGPACSRRGRQGCRRSCCRPRGSAVPGSRWADRPSACAPEDARRTTPRKGR